MDQASKTRSVLSLTTDGKECSAILVPRGDQVKSKVKWEGQFLLIDSVTEIEGNRPLLSKISGPLSEDGKININWLAAFYQS